MKVGFFQFWPIFKEKEKNLKKVKEKLNQVYLDLIVLPELFLTGYEFSSKDEIYQYSDDPEKSIYIEQLLDLSKKRKCILIGGFAENYKEKLYNSAFLMAYGDLIGIYRKIHLFDYEKILFSPGDKGFQVYSVGRVNIGLMICFDWFFPEAARTLALKGSQIIAHPANLILPYCQDAMITRSIENRVFTITCNRIGRDKKLTFTGKSQITSPEGKILARADDSSEVLIYIDIEPDRANDKKVTASNDLFMDRKPQFYFT